MDNQEQIKFTEVIKFIENILSSNDKFNDFMSKANVNINQVESAQIKNTLNFLNTEKANSKPINKIINELTKILADNKVELYEIPELINVIYEALRDTDTITLKTSDLGILIKLILFILIETKVVKILNEDYMLISKVIDTSMMLLNKTVEIKLPNISRCSLFKSCFKSDK